MKTKSNDTRICRGCGIELPREEEQCPICKVRKKSDLKRPQVVAYVFFLLLSTVCGIAVFKLYVHR